jgi:hypothetical protein
VGSGGRSGHRRWDAAALDGTGHHRTRTGGCGAAACPGGHAGDHPDCDGAAHPNRNADSDANSYADRRTLADPVTDSYPDEHADTDTHGHANTDGYPDARAHHPGRHRARGH